MRSWSREFQVNPRNPAKFTKTREIPRNSLKILPNTCRHNIFESYLGCWGCLPAVNLLIYLETSSLQRVNNIPKLPGVLKLKPRRSSAFLARVDRGRWGWVWQLLTLRMLRFVKGYVLYAHLTYCQRWRSISERFSPRMIMPEKPANVHALSHGITNKPCTSSYYKSNVTTDLKNKL